jgi:hypothetical protein
MAELLQQRRIRTFAPIGKPLRGPVAAKSRTCLAEVAA